MDSSILAIKNAVQSVNNLSRALAKYFGKSDIFKKLKKFSEDIRKENNRIRVMEKTKYLGSKK